jgi:hypothetical protein
VAGIDLAFDVPRHIVDAVEVGDGRSAELHHDARHGWKNAFYKLKRLRQPAGAVPEFQGKAPRDAEARNSPVP